MSGSIITVRKIKLSILNEDKELRSKQYEFIRNSQYAQYKGLNRCMGYIMAGYYNNKMDIKSESFKEHMKTVNNSLNIFSDIEFGKGVDSKSAITQKVKKDFSTALRNGLAKGERTITNYRRTFPLMTRGRDLKFRYNDDTDEIFVKWVNGIDFKCITGFKKNEVELKHTLHKVINGEYTLGQSSLMFDRNNKLVLNLTISMPKVEKDDFISGRVCGVDIGLRIPAFCSLNDNDYIRKSIGSFEEFAKVRVQFKSRRTRLQKQLKACKGGRGREDKLKAMNQLRDKEKNFANTYNHFLSKNIVKFAKDNQCEFIHLEDINKIGLDDKILGMWSYYQLKTHIENKAKVVGIKVLSINPAYTSQMCSKCGTIDKDNRKSQESFICVNCGNEMNADHNASVNIARSTDIVKKSKD